MGDVGAVATLMPRRGRRGRVQAALKRTLADELNAAAQLARDGACHADQARHGGREVDLPLPAVEPHVGGDEHDAPAAQADHALGCPPDAPDRPGVVDVEDLRH